jgi:nucleotide-binding universal stress UspA family protein
VKSPERILVLYEHTRAGAAAIDLACDLAQDGSGTITVVGIAPVAPSGPRCGNSALEYNEAVADSVARDLAKARDRVGAKAARFEVLPDDALEPFAKAGAFDLVLLPGHRRPLRKPGHPAASKLSGVGGAEIRIVGPASQTQPRRPGVAAG